MLLPPVPCPLARRFTRGLAQPPAKAALGTVSLVDVEAPDAARFPLFAGADYTEAILGPGDAVRRPPWAAASRAAALLCVPTAACGGGVMPPLHAHIFN